MSSTYTVEEIKEFINDGMDLLESAETALLNLDKGGDFKTSFDTVFRCFHNLKGASGVMEMDKLQKHVHELETILMQSADLGQLSKSNIEFFLKGIDAAKIILEGKDVEFGYEPTLISQQSESIPVTTTESKKEQKKEENTQIIAEPQNAPAPGFEIDPALAEFFAECSEILERVSEQLQKIESGVKEKSLIDGLYRDVHSLKGAAYLFSYRQIGDVAHHLESNLEGVRDGKAEATTALNNLLFEGLDLLEKLVAKAKIGQKLVIFDDEVNLFVSKVLAAEIESAPAVNQEVVAPVVSTSVVSAGATNSSSGSSSSGGSSSDDKNKQVAQEESNSSIRVSVSLLDNLMTLMGEMVLVRNQILQFANKSDDLDFLSIGKKLNVVTSEIQEEMMKTRMQPIGNTLNKFNRVVRDLSNDLKKSIQLHIEGAETELDKSLLEAIKDPLTHIIRNSCDHGIEIPEVRRHKGKTEKGNVFVKAYHEGGQVVVEVQDDGKGLHKDTIINKALEKGIIDQQRAARLSEKEIFNLIFEPGFSTAAQVTNLSGRGVGMDVVRTNIEKIGGTVELSSVFGAGTNIKMKIPLTLAIVPALIINCADSKFAIPQVKLEELVRVDQSQNENKIEFLHGSLIYRLRGHVLPLLDMCSVLNLEERAPEFFSKGIINIAVLKSEQGVFGVIIDEIQDTADIVVKPINRLLKSLNVYSGATILGDGSVALIFDVLGLSKYVQMNHTKTEGTHNINDKVAQAFSDVQEFLLVKTQSPAKHAIVLGYVHRLEEFSKSQIEFSGPHRMIRYRDSILPLVYVNETLGYPNKESDATTVPVVVIQRAGSLYGLVVDEILDILSTSVQTDSHLIQRKGIFGNLRTDDQIVVVIDPFELISMALPDSQQNKDQSFQTENNLIFNTANKSTAVAKKKILFVEDTAFFRKTIKNALESAGYDVLVAGHGQEAMDLLNEVQGQVDLVLSDIEMPVMNGFELALKIRANDKYKHIPMVAISSKADANFVQRGFECGFNSYLEKFKPEVLTAELKKQFNQMHRQKSA